MVPVMKLVKKTKNDVLCEESMRFVQDTERQLTALIEEVELERRSGTRSVGGSLSERFLSKVQTIITT